MFVLALSGSTATYAQELGPTTTSRVAPTDQTSSEPAPKVTDHTFWLVGAALNTAMILDMKSTFDVERRCAMCYEANPVAAPFINQGPRVAFVAAELFDIALMSAAAKMKGSDRAWVRHIWWVAPVAVAAGHTVAYRHNVNLKF